MDKITKIQVKSFIKGKLAKDPKWIQNALLKIFEKQTDDEKLIEATTDHNGVGFTGVDAEILSSFAKQLKTKGYLSNKQMQLLSKKMPKYWNQIYKISDKQKLITIMKNISC
jgi:hypothetical protein